MPSLKCPSCDEVFGELTSYTPTGVVITFSKTVTLEDGDHLRQCPYCSERSIDLTVAVGISIKNTLEEEQVMFEEEGLQVDQVTIPLIKGEEKEETEEEIGLFNPDWNIRESTIVKMVQDDLETRATYGEEKYGGRLKPFSRNNRKTALQNLYEELLDAAQYIKQQIEEDKVLTYEFTAMAFMLQRINEGEFKTFEDVRKAAESALPSAKETFAKPGGIGRVGGEGKEAEL